MDKKNTVRRKISPVKLVQDLGPGAVPDEAGLPRVTSGLGAGTGLCADAPGPRLREAARRELARRHLADFALYTNPCVSVEGFHKVYYRVLELFGQGRIRRLMVTVPPQHGKSLGSSVLLPAWMLGRDPGLRIAIASYNAKLASRFNRQINALLASKKYASLFPASALQKGAPRQPGYIRTDEQTDIPGYGGGTLAVGREGTLTGNSVDIAVMDDLYKDAMEAYSPVVRENCWEWYTSVVRTRMHNRSQELIVFTRWHEEDLVGRISTKERVVELTRWEQLDGLPADAWVHLKFEAIKESPPSHLDPRAPGEPLWPARHCLALLEGKRRLDPVRFEALYQGRPVSGEGCLYGIGIQTYRDLPPDIVEWGNYTDTADTGDDYLCSVCYAIGRDRLVYITDVVYSREPMEVTEGMVAKMLTANGTRIARIEGNNGGRGFARALSRMLPELAIETFHQSANKEARILSAAPALLRNMRMPEGWAGRWPQFYTHVTTYRREFRANRWHDVADALTGVIEKTSAPAGKKIRAIRFRE